MKKPKEILPPRWATRLLSWYCKPDLLEDLQGDLNEYFARNLKDKGPAKARLIYIIDVLKFFRPYTVRKPEFLNLIIHLIMIQTYVKTSGRSIVRNKLFSTINIIGLAISMSVGLLIIAMMTDLNSYDKFHDKHDRIYRVISQYQFNGRKDRNFMATTSPKAAQAIKESFAGVEDVAILRRDFRGDISAGEKTIPLSGLWANPSFFNVFSFPLLYGNPANALNDAFSVVLTEKAALKLFGASNVVGKVVTFNRGKENERDYTVTGVLKDIPKYSHVKFEMLGSLATRSVMNPDDKQEMSWDNVWHTWTYVLLQDKSNAVDLKRNLIALSKREDKSVPYTHIEFDVQPMTSIVTGQDLGNQIGTTMGNKVVWILGCLSFIVILSAGLNYTNLSIARSFRRSREVGIRKTIGALKSHVVNQFIVESVIISLLALILAFGLFLFFKPYFLGIEPSLRELLVLDLSPLLVTEFVVFAIIVGVCAGFFPAMYFGRINAVQVLKNLSAIPALKGLTMRKVLIVFQYCISIIGITATLIIYKQYKHFVAYDLGFTTENILNISLQGNQADLLKKELAEMPEVKGISESQMITSTGNYWGAIMKNPNDPLDSVAVGFNGIDENYLPLHDHQFIAGRNFTARPAKAEESEVIVNEETLKRFNIAKDNPSDAIGEVVEINRKKLKIIGVIRDFQYGRANDRSRSEVIMRYTPDETAFLNVKILSSDWPATYAKIESIWKKIDKVHPMEAKFYSEQIEEAFRGLNASMKVGYFLAFLIICIASIGLLGMVVYSTETRRREVSIRKVFGAREWGLLIILSKSFLVLLIVAAAIGLPVTYFFFDIVLLPEIANHAPLGLFEMTAGVAVVLCIALVMIGTQTLKVARTNPAEVLKTE